MGQITLENNTNNALKVDLATQIQGEDSENNWMKVNAQGYTQAKGRKFTVSTSAQAVVLGLTAQVISVFNPGTATIWTRLDGEAATTAYPAIPIPPCMTITLPVMTEDTISFIGEAEVAGVAVVAMGNALPE